MVNLIIQVNDDAEETRKIIFRVFRMWSSYHKAQDDWFFQKHHFLGLTCGSDWAQGGNSAQCIRAFQGKRYLQPPGKVSKGPSCVATDPRSTAPPLSSLNFYHHYCQTIWVLQLDLCGLKSMWVFFSPSFFKCAYYFVFLLEKADGKIYALHLKLNVLTFTVDLRDFMCLDCLRLSFKEVLAQTIFASSEKVPLH